MAAAFAVYSTARVLSDRIFNETDDMARHSHWHNIQLKKGKADARRAGAFSKLAKNITVAAREGGGDPSFNFKLRMAVDAAKAVSMPKDNIERAIARGTGGGEGGTIEEIVYEGFGPGGVAVLAVCLTDNRNRTVSEVKLAASKAGGSIGASGAVMWMFEKKGVVRVASVADEMALIEAGAENIVALDDVVEIICDVRDLQKIVAAAGTVVNAAVEYVAKNVTEITDEAARRSLDAFVEALEDLDDVDAVYTNET
jgi:YebC/PmpR family DNA-binding regulatory protein